MSKVGVPDSLSLMRNSATLDRERARRHAAWLTGRSAYVAGLCGMVVGALAQGVGHLMHSSVVGWGVGFSAQSAGVLAMLLSLWHQRRYLKSHPLDV